MRTDVSPKRCAAFAKRLLQVALPGPAHFACGALLLVSEVLKVCVWMENMLCVVLVLYCKWPCQALPTLHVALYCWCQKSSRYTCGKRTEHLVIVVLQVALPGPAHCACGALLLVSEVLLQFMPQEYAHMHKLPCTRMHTHTHAHAHARRLSPLCGQACCSQRTHPLHTHVRSHRHTYTHTHTHTHTHTGSACSVGRHASARGHLRHTRTRTSRLS